MKLSTILAPLNETLKTNLERPNKTENFTPRNGVQPTREVLSYAKNCSFINKANFDTSTTKIFIDNYKMETLLIEALNVEFPNIPFSISKDSHSTYDLRTYQLKAEDIGLNKKYQSEINMFQHITSFKVKQKQTAFGLSSSYDQYRCRDMFYHL